MNSNTRPFTFVSWPYHFSRRFKQARKLSELTKAELTVKLGFLTTDVPLRVSKFEHGKDLPTIDELVRIGFVLDVSIDWLVGLSEDPTPRGYNPQEDPHLSSSQGEAITDPSVESPSDEGDSEDP